MRSVSVVWVFLATFVLLALPACEFGSGGSALEAPDGGKACPLPAPQGCSQEECNTFGGCTHFDCDPGSGEWLMQECEPPPAPIDGHWTLSRSLRGQADPCPEITRVDPLELDARPAAGGGEAISTPDGSKLSLGEIHPGLGLTDVVFGFDETWSAGDAALPVRVSYALEFRRDGDVTGEATATVPSGDHTCGYTFFVDGDRKP
jgi:hypothetical protein